MSRAISDRRSLEEPAHQRWVLAHGYKFGIDAYGQFFALLERSAGERFGMTPQALQSASRQRHLTSARAWVALQVASLPETFLPCAGLGPIGP
jgi:hypothetical protein